MSESLSLGTAGATTRDRTHTLFGQTMGYVAVTTGFFALGSYLGRNLSPGWAFVWYIASERPATRPGGTCRGSPGCASGR